MSAADVFSLAGNLIGLLGLLKSGWRRELAEMPGLGIAVAWVYEGLDYEGVLIVSWSRRYPLGQKLVDGNVSQPGGVCIGVFEGDDNEAQPTTRALWSSNHAEALEFVWGRIEEQSGPKRPEGWAS